MKNILPLGIIGLFLLPITAALGQTVSRSYVAPSSVTVDNQGNYGFDMPSVSFTTSDFTQGCLVNDVNVVIGWAKTAGTCAAPTGGNSQHQETSFRINHPTAAPEILALPGTWSGQVSTSSVVTTFSDGNPIPSGTPVTGTFGPNNGILANYNGISPAGNWFLEVGDNAATAPVCVVFYQVDVTTAPDNTPPVLTVPANITVNADPGNCGTTVSFTAPTATDACTATVTQTAGPLNGSFIPVGVSTLTYQAADPYGNTTTQSFTITVVDNQNPVITCPGTVFAGCNTTVNYPLPTATDNCAGTTVNLVSGPFSGGTFTPGTTSVTYSAVDASGNTVSCSFNVVVDTESTDPTSITASTLSVCAGDPVTLTVNGGSLGTNAQWYWYVGSCGGQLVAAGSTVTVNPFTTANYYVRAEGPCNSSDCVDVLITVTPAPSVTFSNISSPSACGAADGTITAVAVGGAPPYTFSWTNGPSTPVYSGLAAGPYEVMVTDATGCTDFSAVSLSDPGASPVSLTSSDPDNIICEGEYVTFTASGAFQYQYYVDAIPVSTQNPWTTNTLQDGQTVTVVGLDFNFCSFTAPGISFVVHDNPIIDETVSDPSACATPDGVIQTSVSGGLPPYSYLWSYNNETGPNISGLPAGPYLITVTDANGCSTNETYALNDPGALPVTLTSSEDPNNVICAGESITFTASGSVDYEFFVDAQPVSTTNPYTTAALVDGQSVAATGTDGNNCTATSNIIYPTVNPGPIITLISNDADTTICIDQSISFFASGGLTYEFLVNGVSQGAPSATSVFVSSTLVDGDVVSVIGTDGNGCDVESAGMTVTVNPSPTVSITSYSDPTSCGATDGVITADATGGTPNYTYTWAHAPVGPTVANLNAGSYFVLVTDDAGCTGVASQSLSDIGSSPVTMTSSVQNNTICGGDEVVFTATGATTYVFYVNGVQVSTQNPFVTSTLLNGDIIAVTGLDTQLCAATSAPETYTVHPAIQVGVVSFINPSACGAMDGLANAITIGGVPTFNYVWTPTGQVTPSATNLAAGAYSVTVTDANGCQATDGVSLSDPGSLSVSLVADPAGQVICAGTPITFTASGADNYEFFINGISAGVTNPYVNTTLTNGQTIAVVGTDASNCTATSPGLQYQVNSVPQVTLSLGATACSNQDSIQLSGGIPLGGSFTVVYGGTPITGNLFFPEEAGPGLINVDYTYTAANGCSATASDNYVVLAAPVINLGNDTTVCGIVLDAGSGYVSYAWTPTGDTTSSIQVFSTNVFEVTVEDANGCFGSDAIGITVNPIPAPVITPGGTVEFCIGEWVTLTAQSGFSSYDWSTSSTVDTTFVNSSGTVTLTVTNQYGCEGVATVEAIMHEPMPGAVITADGPLEFCVGGSVNLNAGSGYASYLWSHGSTTQIVQVIQSGQYTVVVMDGNGCIDSSMTADPVVVTVWDPEPLVLENGDELVITNASDFNAFQWYFNGDPIPGATGETYNIQPTGHGYYQVCVVDEQGCEGCSFIYEMSCCIGIQEAFFDGEASVYPNPNSGTFTLEVEMQREMDMTIGLYDMVGKQIWSDQDLGSVSSLRKQYDLSQMPDGVYFLRIHADDQMTVQRLIKQQ